MNVRFINQVIRILLSKRNETSKLLGIISLFVDNGNVIAKSLLDWYDMSSSHERQTMEVHEKNGEWEVVYTFKKW
jgi:hypothetical protein